MNATVTTTQLDLLFEERVRLTDVVEYGFSMNDLLEGKTPIPPEGARFDIYFEGMLQGERIKGTIAGVDYLEVRADGRYFLNLQARIRTEDGANIQLRETGINSQGALHLQMDFHTNDRRYSWLNSRQVLGVGTVDFTTAEANVQGFLI